MLTFMATDSPLWPRLFPCINYDMCLHDPISVSINDHRDGGAAWGKKAIHVLVWLLYYVWLVDLSVVTLIYDASS